MARRKALLANRRLKAGNFELPSPDDILAASSAGGGWSARQLAEWGIPSPPPKGWRVDLETRWAKAHGALQSARHKMKVESQRPYAPKGWIFITIGELASKTGQREVYEFRTLAEAHAAGFGWAI